MRFDVGQRVLTPQGEAMVVQHTSGVVFTDVGRFPEGSVMAWIDRDQLRDPSTLERWLDGEFDPDPEDPWEGVELVDGHCRCDCGDQGRCHRVFHKRGQQVIFRSQHLTISTDCRCKETECWCLN